MHIYLFTSCARLPRTPQPPCQSYDRDRKENTWHTYYNRSITSISLARALLLWFYKAITHSEHGQGVSKYSYQQICLVLNQTSPSNDVCTQAFTPKRLFVYLHSCLRNSFHCGAMFGFHIPREQFPFSTAKTRFL